LLLFLLLHPHHPTSTLFPYTTLFRSVYYCSQAVVDASCALSIDGGLTYGPAVPIYTLAQCGGLHGHIKVGRDGTAYVPNKNCGGDRKSTRLNSSHLGISYAVFCLKKK